MLTDEMKSRRRVTFKYTNWRNETAVREVIPDRVIWLDEPDYGYKPGWFLLGWDVEKEAMRQFSLDPERMVPHDYYENAGTDSGGAALARTVRQPLSAHGVNILIQVR